MGGEKYASTKLSQPRRDHQPTAAELASIRIKVKDFAYQNDLPPVRTIYRQRKQIQPSVFQQIHREDTEPLDGISDSSQQSLCNRESLHRTTTEPVLEEKGLPLAREFGGFFDITSTRVINFTLTLG